MQPPFDHAKGVVSTVVGYCGGGEANPTYQQVSAGKTGPAFSLRFNAGYESRNPSMIIPRHS